MTIWELLKLAEAKRDAAWLCALQEVRTDETDSALIVVAQHDRKVRARAIRDAAVALVNAPIGDSTAQAVEWLLAYANRIAPLDEAAIEAEQDRADEESS